MDISSDLQEIYRIYEDLLADVEQEFNRVRDMFIDRMQALLEDRISSSSPA